MVLNILKSLKVDKDNTILTTVIENNVKMASYFKELLEQVYGVGEVI